jgi:hypothetical protein
MYCWCLGELTCSLPALSALRPLPLANPFRHFPNGSNLKRLKSPQGEGEPFAVLLKIRAPGLAGHASAKPEVDRW